jgi:hypothetical protein
VGQDTVLQSDRPVVLRKKRSIGIIWGFIEQRYQQLRVQPSVVGLLMNDRLEGYGKKRSWRSLQYYLVFTWK